MNSQKFAFFGNGLYAELPQNLVGQFDVALKLL